MADIDTAANIAEFTRLIALAEEKIQGLTNMEGDGYTPQEKVFFGTQRNRWIELKGLWEAGRAAMDRMRGLGYPALPTMEVPESVMASILRENRETLSASQDFHAPGAATSFDPNFVVSDQP